MKGEQKGRQEVKGLEMNGFFHMLTHVRVRRGTSGGSPHLSLCWQQVTSQQREETVRNTLRHKWRISKSVALLATSNITAARRDGAQHDKAQVGGECSFNFTLS